MRAWSCAIASIAMVTGCTLISTGMGTGGGVVAAVSTGTTTGSGDSTLTDPGPEMATRGGSGADTTSAPTSSPSTGDQTLGETTEGTSSDPTERSTGESDRCDRVLWVTANTTVSRTTDALYYQRLVDRGYDVTIIDSPGSEASDVADNCLVVLSSVGEWQDLDDKFRDVTVPVVVMEGFVYDSMRMVAGPSNCGTISMASSVMIVADGHPLAGGATGTVSVYQNDAVVGYAIPEPAAEIIAVDVFEEEIALLFGYDEGDMLNNMIAPARRVGFPAGGLNGDPTADGVDLFEAAVEWALE